MKCIIVDDEPLARLGLEKMIKTYTDFEVVGIFNTPLPVLQFVKDNDVDLVFLDIEMGANTGIELAKKINHKTLIIFVTAYPQFALEGYELEAVDYLVKPLNVKRFKKATGKAKMVHQLLKLKKIHIDSHSAEHLLIKSGSKYTKILFEEILYIEGLKDYSIIKMQTTQIIAAMNLKTIFEKLPSDMFMRVSKSFIVQTAAIESFTTSSINIAAAEIPLGRKYQKDFFESYSKK